MKAAWNGFSRFIAAVVRLVVGVVSALLLLLMGLVLVVIAASMAVDDTDHTKTTTTTVQSTVVTAPAGTPAPAPVTTGTDSVTTAIESSNAVSGRSDTLVVALLVTGVALILVALLWRRVTSIEVGPTGLKLALQQVAAKADQAKKQGASSEDVAAAALATIAKLVELFSPPRTEAAGRRTVTTFNWRRNADLMTALESHPALPADLDRATAETLATLTFDAELAVIRDADRTQSEH